MTRKTSELDRLRGRTATSCMSPVCPQALLDAPGWFNRVPVGLTVLHTVERQRTAALRGSSIEVEWPIGVATRVGTPVKILAAHERKQDLRVLQRSARPSSWRFADRDHETSPAQTAGGRSPQGTRLRSSPSSAMQAPTTSAIELHSVASLTTHLERGHTPDADRDRCPDTAADTRFDACAGQRDSEDRPRDREAPWRPSRSSPTSRGIALSNACPWRSSPSPPSVSERTRHGGRSTRTRSAPPLAPHRQATCTNQSRIFAHRRLRSSCPPRNGGLPMTASNPPRSSITSGASTTQCSGCHRS